MSKQASRFLTLPGHATSVYGVAFSPNGNRIVSGGNDKNVLVRDAKPKQNRKVPIQAHDRGETAQVDLIELNHRFYDASETVHNDQVLFWSLYPDGQLHLRDWRIVGSPSMIPQRKDGKWVCSWREDDFQFQVEAARYRETKTVSSSYDPEQHDRKPAPKISRVPLWKTAQ